MAFDNTKAKLIEDCIASDEEIFETLRATQPKHIYFLTRLACNLTTDTRNLAALACSQFPPFVVHDATLEVMSNMSEMMALLIDYGILKEADRKATADEVEKHVKVILARRDELTRGINGLAIGNIFKHKFKRDEER